MIQICFVLRRNTFLFQEDIKSLRVDLQYLRGSLGGIRVLELLLLASPDRNVAHHLPLIAGLVLPGQVLKFTLLLGRHCLKTENQLVDCT